MHRLWIAIAIILVREVAQRVIEYLNEQDDTDEP